MGGIEEDQEEDSKCLQYSAILLSNRTSRHCKKDEAEKAKKEEVAQLWQIDL